LLQARSRFLQIADDFAWLNPHLSITASWDGKRQIVRTATKLDWKKWRANEPTSAHWYTLSRFERYAGAHIARDEDMGRERTVREFISEFRGLSGSGKQKAVLDEVGASRASLARFFGRPETDHAAMGKLLAACRKHTRPVKPLDIGVIGKDHIEALFVADGVAKASFNYGRQLLVVSDGVPQVAEVAFGYLLKGTARRIIYGVNWSVAIGHTPFRNLGRAAESLDSLLTDQRAGRDEPVLLMVHLASPVIQYTDRGKSSISLEDPMAEAERLLDERLADVEDDAEEDC
jgi:hypothetical protein